MHLERYLKVTNQYLHATLDGANLTSNEQINHLIRTNILTNKIAANNLISIINKLLEQNIISEYYFKHASRLMMQSYENVTAAAAAANFTDSNVRGGGGGDCTNDKDAIAFELFEKCSKLSPTAQSANTTIPHQPSELLKELIKQRELRFNIDAVIPPPPPSAQLLQLDDDDDGGGASDGENNDNNSHHKLEMLDYDDTIKKETIPVHANPFMSYLHMHLNRSLDKCKTDNKYFNGAASISIPTNSVSPTDSTSMSPLIAPTEAGGKTKTHKKRSNHHLANTANNYTNNNNNNNSHSKSSSSSSSHNSRYDLALNLSQRLFCVSLSLCLSVILMCTTSITSRAIGSARYSFHFAFDYLFDSFSPSSASSVQFDWNFSFLFLCFGFGFGFGGNYFFIILLKFILFISANFYF